MYAIRSYYADGSAPPALVTVEPAPAPDSPIPDPDRLQSVLLNNDVFALYGKPGARTMGILGQYSLEAIGPVMDDFVRRYDAANGQRGIIPSFRNNFV